MRAAATVETDLTLEAFARVERIAVTVSHGDRQNGHAFLNVSLTVDKDLNEFRIVVDDECVYSRLFEEA